MMQGIPQPQDTNSDFKTRSVTFPYRACSLTSPNTPNFLPEHTIEILIHKKNTSTALQYNKAVFPFPIWFRSPAITGTMKLYNFKNELAHRAL